MLFDYSFFCFSSVRQLDLAILSLICFNTESISNKWLSSCIRRALGLSGNYFDGHLFHSVSLFSSAFRTSPYVPTRNAHAATHIKIYFYCITNKLKWYYAKLLSIFIGAVAFSSMLCREDKTRWTELITI